MAALVVRVGQTVLSLIATIILARLLSPRDFGIFAMVVPVYFLVNNLANQNFQTAIIQAQAQAHVEMSALFWFALRMNTLLAVAFIAAAIGLAWLYAEPRVVPVAVVWAAALLPLTLTTFQEAQLKREMRFPTVLGIHLAGMVAGVATGVGAAVLGAGYWALLIQALTMEATRAMCIHVVSQWRPQRVDRGQLPPSLRSFWFSLAGFRLSMWLSEQPDRLFVGRFGDAATFGLYDTSRRWAWYAFTEPFQSLSDIAVASLSAIRRDAQQFRLFLNRHVRALLTIALPPIAFAGIESASVVSVLLGPQWDDAAPYLRILCIAAFCGTLGRLTQWISFSLGDTRRILRWWLLVQTPVLVVAVALGAVGGPRRIASGYAAAHVVLALPTVAFCLRTSPVSPTDFLRAAARPAAAVLGALLVLMATQRFLPSSVGATRLSAALAIYLVALTGAWLALPGGPAATRELLVALRYLRQQGQEGPA